MFKDTRKKLQGLVLGLLLLSIALPGCTAQGTETSPDATKAVTSEAASPEETALVETVAATEAAGPRVGGDFVISFGDQPDTLDAHKSGFSSMSSIVGKMGASLLALNADGKIVPYLAKSWEMSTDGLVWTFFLRHDVKFHNGDPVTAQDWVYTIQRMQNPETVSPNASMVEPITSIEAVDDYTLKITLDQPFYQLLNTLAIPSYLGVWSKRAIEEGGDRYGSSEVGVVGAGPYLFKEWVQDERIVLQRNPDYTWGPVLYEGCNTGPYFIDTIEYRIIPDYSTTLAALETAEIDFAGVTNKDLAMVEATGAYNIESALSTGVIYLEFNLRIAPFDNELFRQAINRTIDRDVIVNVTLNGSGQKNLTPISPAMIGYDPQIEASGLDYDPELAKELFQQAGYTYDEAGTLLKNGEAVKITLLSASDELAVKLAQILVSQFAAVGIELEIQSMEWGAQAQQMSAGNFEADIMEYGYRDTDILYLVYHSDSGFWNGINDPEVDRLLDLTRTEMDPVKHQEAINAAAEYLMEHAYMAPLLSYTSSTAISNKIAGYRYSPFIGMTLADAYFTDLP